MKAAPIRKLAEAHTAAELNAFADALAEGEDAAVDHGGDDLGEGLTHLMLASRVRARMEQDDEPLPKAFRAVMADVRGTLQND